MRGWTVINGALVVAIVLALLALALRPGAGGPGLEIERREPRPARATRLLARQWRQGLVGLA